MKTQRKLINFSLILLYKGKKVIDVIPNIKSQDKDNRKNAKRNVYTILPNLSNEEKIS